VTGGWTPLYSGQLNSLYASRNIISVSKSRRMRWAGHVARIAQVRNTRLYRTTGQLVACEGGLFPMSSYSVHHSRALSADSYRLTELCNGLLKRTCTNVCGSYPGVDRRVK
jgi:hypothetical protein